MGNKALISSIFKLLYIREYRFAIQHLGCLVVIKYSGKAGRLGETMTCKKDKIQLIFSTNKVDIL